MQIQDLFSPDAKEQHLFISELMPESELNEIISGENVGLELIAFSISSNLDRFSETMEDVRGMVSRLGNPALTVHGPFLDLNPMTFDSQIRSVTMYRFAQAYEAAQMLGASTVIYHSGMIPTVYYLEGWADRMVDFWNEFMRGRSGIRVCMENVLDREYAPFLQIASEVTHPDFGICLDAGHAHCYSSHDAFAWAQTLSGHIRHLHLHDNDRSFDQHHELGNGSVPWCEILSVLSDTPDLTCTIECADKGGTIRSIRNIRDSRKVMS